MSNSNQTTATDPNSNLDLLVVGAGFSGIYLLHVARQAGLSVKLFEAGGNFGGVWHWNCYPGARTDSEYNVYQFSLPEIWKEWTWKERYASRDELVEYFEFVDSKLHLKKDIAFNTYVTKADWDNGQCRWVVRTDTGVTASPRFLVMCTGYGFKPYYPNIKGLETFKGISTHTSRWPTSGIDPSGKRIGVIGTGASGVQVIQSLAPKAAQMIVFQRTYNTALPMMQRIIDKTKEDLTKEVLYPSLFRRQIQLPAKADADFNHATFFEQPPEKIQLELQEMWEKGVFRLWLGSYASIEFGPAANDIVYQFWRSKILPRVKNPEIGKLLAPEKSMYPFGYKRTTLEQGYYEIYDLPHVDLVDIRTNPILEVTEKGVRTRDQVEWELDVLILATGFDAVTGALTSVDISGTDKEEAERLREKWDRDGAKTFLGMASNGFPNLFFIYGPQSPTGYCVGPVCAELQADWIVRLLSHLRTQQATRIEATPRSQEEYTHLVNEIYAHGLGAAPATTEVGVNSWWNGSNVPGKLVQALNFQGGVARYRELLEKCENGHWGGFMID